MNLGGEHHSHHHSLLAGVSAGAMAVLVAFGLLLLAWHRIAGAVGEAVIVIVWAVAAVVVAGAVTVSVYAVLWLRHRLRHPEVLTGRQAIRAEAVNEAVVPQAIEAPATSPAAIEPPRMYLNVSPDQLAAIMRHHAEEEGP